MMDCFFTKALPNQRGAYRDFCNSLASGQCKEWGEVRERFRHVVDPFLLLSGLKYIYLSEEGLPLTIPLPVCGVVSVGTPFFKSDKYASISAFAKHQTTLFL